MLPCVKLNLSISETAKNDVKNENPPWKKKFVESRVLKCFKEAIFLMLWKLLVIVIFKSLFLFKCVSLKTVIMKITFIRLNIAAAMNGVVAVKYVEIEGSDNLPPMYGPTIIPSPKVAPISPKFFALFSGFVMSAIAACATEIFPPIIP